MSKKKGKIIKRLIVGLLIIGGLAWLIGLSLQGAADYMQIEEQQWMHEHENLD